MSDSSPSNQRDGMREQIDAYVAKIERLTAELEVAMTECKFTNAENERLRAALEEVCDPRTHLNGDVLDRARKALAGAAVETDDCPRSTDGRHEFGCIKCGEPTESATAQEADHRHCFWPGERHGMDHKCAKCGRLDREHACPCWKLGGQETNTVL